MTWLVKSHCNWQLHPAELVLANLTKTWQNHQICKQSLSLQNFVKSPNSLLHAKDRYTAKEM